jgi:hypothetical protein
LESDPPNPQAPFSTLTDRSVSSLFPTKIRFHPIIELNAIIRSLAGQRSKELAGCSFRLSDEPKFKEYEYEMGKQYSTFKMGLELDTEWIQKRTKVKMTVNFAQVFCLFFFWLKYDTHTTRELSEPTHNVNTNKKSVSHM